MSFKRRQPSLITNDLIRISLLLESMLDQESTPQSLGGTPKKVGQQVSVIDTAI